MIFSTFEIGCSKKALDPESVTPALNVPATPPVIQQVDNTSVISTGNDNRSDYPISNTLDARPETFMTTHTVSNGTMVYVAYKFTSQLKLSRIEIVDNYTNNYNMGDLEVQVSSDSTNGIDGTWLVVTNITAATSNFINGDGAIQINQANVKWLKLKMTYTGTGAYGGTPAFYLSDISFFQEI